MGWKNRGLTADQQNKLNMVATPVKNNLTAIAAPTANDDASMGYSDVSQWVYNGIIYICVSAVNGAALWVNNANIYYFDTWAAMASAISAAGIDYAGKYCNVANANGGAPSGVAYTSSATVVNPISDGGSAVYQVITQGNPYTVKCQPRTVTNPIINAIQTAATEKPTVPGYYIFLTVPTDGLPVGAALGDICYFNGTAWSLFCKYANAQSSITVGTTAQQVYTKNNGIWDAMSLAWSPGDEKSWSGVTALPTAGFLFEDGSAISRTTFANLHAIYHYPLTISLSMSGTATTASTSGLFVGEALELLGSESLGITIASIVNATTFTINIPSKVAISYSGVAQVYPYGNGDGKTTLNLPNCRGKGFMGYDPSQSEFSAVGQCGGSKSHTNTIAEMAQHSHQGHLWGRSNVVPNGANISIVDPGTHGGMDGTVSISIDNNGSGQAYSIMNPYTTRRVLVKY